MPPNPSRRPVKPVGKIKPVGTKRKPRRASSAAGSALLTICLLGAGGAGVWHYANLPKSAEVHATAEAEPAAATPAIAEESVAPESTSKLNFTIREDESPETRAPLISSTVPKVDEEQEKADQERAAKKPKADFTRLLVLDDLQAKQPAETKARSKALGDAFASEDWEGYRDYLDRSLKGWLASRFTGVDTAGAAKLFENPYASEALLRHSFLDISAKGLKAFLKDNDEGAEFITWLLNDNEALKSFTLTATSKDNIESVLRIWSSLAAEDPEAKGTYRELALACGLVFDQLKDASWNGKPLQFSAKDRYRYYRDNSEAGKLTGKIKNMTAGDLVWVVCAPVPQSEMEWALKNADWRQRNWGAAYGSIKYDMEKAVTGRVLYDSYTFAEIKKKGGICGDQSHFCANTARALGIPAVILGGDGPRGGHAWVAWQADEREWEFAGRLGGYPSGHSQNPQTRSEISEDDFVRANDRRAADPTRVFKARQYLWLATLYSGEADKSEALIAAAHAAAPNLPLVAETQLKMWMDTREAEPVENWQKMLAALRKEFRDNSPLMDLAKKAEEENVFNRVESKVAMHTLRREASKVDSTKGAASGIAPDINRLAESFRRQAQLLVDANDLEGVRNVYRRAFSDHGDDPALFKALGKDFFGFVKKDPEVAGKACKDLEGACRRYVGKGGGDWFDTKSQNSAWEVVAKCYRETGDTKKADGITKDIQQREEAAKRKAI